MYAVIKTGGKQYRVNENQVVKVEKLDGEPGGTVVFDQVLMVGEDGGQPQIGQPLIAGMTVSGEILEQTRGDKIIVFKKQRRQNHRRKNGHRQDLTAIRITAIGDAPKKAAKSKAAAKKTEAKPADEAPAADAPAADAPKAETKAKTESKPKAAAKPKAKAKDDAPKTEE